MVKSLLSHSKFSVTPFLDLDTFLSSLSLSPQSYYLQELENNDFTSSPLFINHNQILLLLLLFVLYSTLFVNVCIKVAVTDMRYFAKRKFFGSLVPKENFGLT